MGTNNGVGGNGGAGWLSNITGTPTYYAAGGAGKGPNGVGASSPGFDSYGAGGGYNFGTLMPAQPGVLILRYLT
jgi:hypothetical protein